MLKNFRIFVYPVVVLAAIAYLVSSTTAQKLPAARGWKRVTACRFSFLLPEHMQEMEVQPIDSCLANFEGEGIGIGLDFGFYSNPLSRQDDMKNYRSSVVRINGRKARLIMYDGEYKYPQVTEIHIVTAGPRNGFGNTSLLMSICTNPSVDAEIVRRIYESIKYLGK
jgi:hypothetical protein